MNTTGAIFDLFGIKLYRITKERVYGLLTPELREELEAEPNVKLPMNLMIQGLHDDQQLPLARSVEDAGFLRLVTGSQPMWVTRAYYSAAPPPKKNTNWNDKGNEDISQYTNRSTMGIGLGMHNVVHNTSTEGSQINYK